MLLHLCWTAAYRNQPPCELPRGFGMLKSSRISAAIGEQNFFQVVLRTNVRLILNHARQSSKTMK
jgi:hypothetical protein